MTPPRPVGAQDRLILVLAKRTQFVGEGAMSNISVVFESKADALSCAAHVSFCGGACFRPKANISRAMRSAIWA
jgi:hypothetical protein